MAHNSLVAPKPAPPLNIPKSTMTVNVSVIDPGCRFDLPIDRFLKPLVGGKTRMTGPAYSFLIEHSGGQKVLFDLSMRKDIENFSPMIVERIQGGNWKVNTGRNVIEVLEENGIKGSDINAIIWSHMHWDHTGDPSTFPTSTALVVGPGFKEAFVPAYPTNPQSPILESDYAGRELREIAFDEGGLKIGRFNAFDYFGDGSFYLLDTPGHTVAHLCALARVTAGGAADDTFIYMGGDVCHHGAEFRPTAYLPLPKEITPSLLPKLTFVCPGAAFTDIHPKKSAVEPFYEVTNDFPHDIDQAIWCIRGTEEFDCDENIFVIIAHDESLLDILQWYPKSSINDWKAKDMAVRGKWTFLGDFHLPEAQ